MPINLQNIAPGAALRAPQLGLRRATKAREFMNLLAALAATSTLLIFLTFMAFRASAQPVVQPDSTASAPLLFEPYSGPGGPVRYLARAARYTVLLLNDEADIVLQQEKAPSQELQRGGLIVVQAHASLLRLRFVDADPPTSINPADPQNGAASALTAVAYRGVYPGTDIILRGDQQHIQFQLNLGPGASAGNIAIEVSGATGLNLQPDGTAVVHAGSASLLLERPVIGLRDAQGMRTVPGAFRIESGRRLRFMLLAPASSSHPIVGD